MIALAFFIVVLVLAVLGGCTLMELINDGAESAIGTAFLFAAIIVISRVVWWAFETVLGRLM